MNENLKKIKTVEDAFQATGRPEVDFSNVPEDLREYFENTYKAVVITEALNGGKKPDWDNHNERKWRPWFDMSASAFGLAVTDCGSASSHAGSGSRLQNFDSETAEYSATQFKDVWKGVQLG
ncbi:MAG: hypothetical protein VB046_09555 [Paludibacter sp.]|nr:hypothetical protein [Paludibacter sp.]